MLTSIQWARFWRKVEFIGPCWLWTGARSDGYGSFYVQGAERAHRLVWLALYGAIPDRLHVLHHCDNRACVRPSHLFLGTNDDNVADRVAKGRNGHARGAGNGRAVLTEAQVVAIRCLAQQGLGRSELGRRFGVDRATIRRVIREENWTHVA